MSSLNAEIFTSVDAVVAGFRTAMRGFTGTVSLITARAPNGEWRGMAATAVTSVTMDPPTCLVCVNRDTTIHPALLSSGYFYINAMHQDHYDLMGSFSHSKHRDQRFRDGDWEEGREGIPFLGNAQANLFCEVSEHYSVGTHDVFIAHVLEATSRQDHDPLLFGQGSYHRQIQRV